MATTLTLEAPRGGEMLHPGDGVVVRWSTDDGAATIDLDCSIDGGASYQPIALGLAPTARAHAWTIPDGILSRERLRVQARFRIVARGKAGERVEATSPLVTITPRKLPSDIPPPPTRVDRPVRPPVQLESIDPKMGPVVGGATLTILGQHFHPFSVARVGGKDATTVYRSPTMILVITPPGDFPGFVDVTVMNPDTRVSAMKNGYRYDPVPAPKIDAVNPKQGGLVGGTKLTIAGANFTPRTVVSIGEVKPFTTTFVNAGMIEVVVPPRTQPGLVDLSVRNTDGQVATARNVFRYDPVPPPVIESIVPKSGVCKGGETITVLGRGFGPRSLVELGEFSLRSTIFIDQSTLEATTPPRPQSGLVDVRVRNPDGQTVTMPRAFRFD